MAVERKYERDIDLLLAEEFSVSNGFAGWFLSKTKFSGAEAAINDVFVSQSDRDGESDLVVLLDSSDGTRVALFIEDKIDAPFMPQQRERYDMRAVARRDRGEFKDYEVILCAPQAYREKSADASKFAVFISYEEISGAIAKFDTGPRGAYRARFLSTAAHRAANTWQRVDDPDTNLFWESAYQLATQKYPVLEMREPHVSKGALWLLFRPYDFPNTPKLVSVDLKGRQGHVDLSFPNTDVGRFAAEVAPLLESEMVCTRAGASSVIRLRVPPFSIEDGPANGLLKVEKGLEAAVRLVNF